MTNRVKRGNVEKEERKTEEEEVCSPPTQLQSDDLNVSWSLAWSVGWTTLGWQRLLETQQKKKLSRGSSRSSNGARSVEKHKKLEPYRIIEKYNLIRHCHCLRNGGIRLITMTFCPHRARLKRELPNLGSCVLEIAKCF